MPTAAMRTGNFAGVRVPDLQPCHGNADAEPDAHRLLVAQSSGPLLIQSPLAYLSFLPAATQPGLANNLAADVPYGLHSHVPDVRMDYRLSNTFSGFLRYGWSDINSREASIFGPVLGGTNYLGFAEPPRQYQRRRELSRHPRGVPHRL